LERFVGIGRWRLARLGGYVVACTSFWTVLALNNEAVAKATGLKEAWQQIVVGIGGPALIIALIEGVPALVRWIRRPKKDKTVIEGYFQLTPRNAPPPGQVHFRADRMDEVIFQWLQQSSGTSLLYLTGRSGSGKTSLLHASVLPRLEKEPGVILVKIGDYGEAGRKALRDQILAPGTIYQAPKGDLHESPAELVERAGRHLERLSEKRRLVILCDQFEGLLIQQARKQDDPSQVAQPLEEQPNSAAAEDRGAPQPHGAQPQEHQDPILKLLCWLHQTPLANVQALMVLRDGDGDRFIEDLPSLGLPGVEQDKNWKIVGPFRREAARAFLQGSGLGLSDRTIDAIVMHASELDESPDGKVRPIVLNMLGLALEAQPKRAESIRSPEDARKLLRDFSKAILNDPYVRDDAPDILARLVVPEGRKRTPAVPLGDLSRECGLPSGRVYGCLIHLGSSHGFVRRSAGGPNDPIETQVWEVAHDFVARVLTAILPPLRASPWRRLRPWIGPLGVLLAAGVVIVMAQREASKHDRESRRQDVLSRWVSTHGGTAKRTGPNEFDVQFMNLYGDDTLGYAIFAEIEDDFAGLVSRFLKKYTIEA
jgi:hypothetical protein